MRVRPQYSIMIVVQTNIVYALDLLIDEPDRCNTNLGTCDTSQASSVCNSRVLHWSSGCWFSPPCSTTIAKSIEQPPQGVAVSTLLNELWCELFMLVMYLIMIWIIPSKFTWYSSHTPINTVTLIWSQCREREWLGVKQKSCKLRHRHGNITWCNVN